MKRQMSFRTVARNQRSNPAATKELVLEMEEVAAEANALQDDNDDEAPMIDSSDEYSYEEDDEGEAIRRKSRFPRFDSEAACPTFALGIIFAGRVQFKDASSMVWLLGDTSISQRMRRIGSDVNVHGRAAHG